MRQVAITQSRASLVFSPKRVEESFRSGRSLPLDWGLGLVCVLQLAAVLDPNLTAIRPFEIALSVTFVVSLSLLVCVAPA